MSTRGLIDQTISKDVDMPPVALGDTTNLPAGWNQFQESLWETLTFQRNVNTYNYRDSAGLALAMLCADVKARDMAKSDLFLWKRVAKRWSVLEPRQHWMAKRLARVPNQWHSWGEFWRMTITHLELAQNAYILLEKNRMGEVTAMIPIPAGRCRPRITPAGALFYEIAATTEFERAQIGTEGYLIVPSSRMIHLRGKMYDGLMGVSNLQLGDPLFNLYGAITRFQTQLFGSDGRQPLVFESDSAVFGIGDQADAAFRRLKEQLTDRVRRMNNTGDPILLEAGYKAKVIAQNARDAMTTDAFNAMVMRICGLMQCPPHKIFAYESVKYENMASADNQYANDCLLPLATNIEDKFRNALLDEETEWDTLAFEFDRLPLLAGDPKTLSDILDKAVKNGAIEINEYRERLPLDLNPIDGGDVRYVPVNMAIVDRSGKIIVQAATGQNQGQEDPADPGAPKSGLRLVQ